MKGAMQKAMEHMMAAHNLLARHEAGDISEEEMMGDGEEGAQGKPVLDDMESKQMGEEKGEAYEGKETPEEEKKEELAQSGLAPKEGTEIDEDKQKENFMEHLKARGTSPMKKAVMAYKK